MTSFMRAIKCSYRVCAAINAFIIVFCLTNALSAAQSAIPGDKSKFHIYVCLGQSNMAGPSGAIIEEQDKIPHPRVYKQQDNNSWAIATQPLNNPRYKNHGLSPAWTFSHTIADSNPDIAVGIVFYALFGKIELVQPGQGSYNTIVNKSKEAQKKGVLKAILWHQGEGNCCMVPNSQYLVLLKRFMNAYRSAVREPDLPIVVGQLSSTFSQYVNFNIMIQAIGDSIPNGYWLSTEGLEMGHDNIHYTSQGIRDLGWRHAMKILSIVYGRDPVSAVPTRLLLSHQMMSKTDRKTLTLSGTTTLNNIHAWDLRGRSLVTDKSTIATRGIYPIFNKAAAE